MRLHWIVIVALAAIGLSMTSLPGPSLAQESRQDLSRQDLEQALKDQQAQNKALGEQIGQIEAMLKTDVCANPQAAEALLKAVATPVR